MTTGPNRNVENVITLYIDPGLEEIVPGFLENRRRDVQTLETALQENNLAQIHIIGHRMKGDGGGYGFDAISMMGAALEQAAAREDRDAWALRAQFTTGSGHRQGRPACRSTRSGLHSTSAGDRPPGRTRPRRRDRARVRSHDCRSLSRPSSDAAPPRDPVARLI